MIQWQTIPVEDRIYVLRFQRGYVSDRYGETKYEYYTGEKPAKQISKAKRFTLSQAKNAKQFAKTTGCCVVIRVSQKQLFKAALEGN